MLTIWWFGLTGNLTLFLCCVSIFFNTKLLRTLRLVFTLTGQRNEQNECDECDVLFSVILYFLDFSISFIFHVSFTFNDIMTIMLLQSPTPKFHFNIICQHIECLCHQHSLQFKEMCAVLTIFHYILLYFLNLIYS